MRTANIFDPIQPTLDQRVFRGIKPRPDIINYIANTFYQTMDDLYVENSEQYFDLALTGSLTTFQYSETSDCDISVFVHYDELQDLFDIGDPVDIRKQLISIVTTTLDGTMVPGTQHPLQFFVIPPGHTVDNYFKPGMRSGWSFNERGWVVPPEKSRSHDIADEMPELYARASMMAEKMKVLLDSGDIEGAREFFAQIHKKRNADEQAGLGDFSEGNIVYKYLLHEGLFDRLRNEAGVHIAKIAMQIDQIWGKQHPHEKDAVPFIYDYENNHLLYGRPGGYHNDLWNQLPGLESLMSGGMAGLATRPFEAGQYFPKIQKAVGISGPKNEKILNAIGTQLSQVDHIAKTADLEHGEWGGETLNKDQIVTQCMNCGNFRQPDNTWSPQNPMPGAPVSHSICPTCWTQMPGVGNTPYPYTAKVAAPVHNIDKDHISEKSRIPILYDFDRDRIIMSSNYDFHRGSKIIGEYDGKDVFLHGVSKQWINPNYFKRLWVASFPKRPLEKVHMDGKAVETRPADDMTYTQKLPWLVQSSDPWRKGKEWKDFIKNEGIIVDFQIGDPKDDPVEGRIKEINSNSIRIEVEPGEFRTFDDDFLRQIKFKVRDDKKSLSSWKEASVVLSRVGDCPTGDCDYEFSPADRRDIALARGWFTCPQCDKTHYVYVHKDLHKH